ncbi:hypothetical protein [Clostridium estertheticum]|uniref:hypothetical protein n=1 Tax=Clostridium estertheticum TaxID=238834 RepID=UPI00124EB02C|nr:hypothetical protein [Clostridium estertheticum]MBZ9615276.1 hypothetical protein [Clostridium estertheticum subsp. laramiense]WAG75165.1 hypothetical protein LL032_06870 [Clostridium estertheticum]
MLNQILNFISNQVVPVAVAGTFAFLIKEITPVGTALISLFDKKKIAVANKIGIDTYNGNIEKATNVWGEVDEEFRITPLLTKTIEAAQDLFAQKLLKVIPGLTTDDIEHLRQSVAGVVNKGKADLIAPVEKTAEVIEKVAPTKKYFDDDGVELTQVVAKVETTDTTGSSGMVINPIDGQPIL